MAAENRSALINESKSTNSNLKSTLKRPLGGKNGKEKPKKKAVQFEDKQEDQKGNDDIVFRVNELNNVLLIAFELFVNCIRILSLFQFHLTLIRLDHI